ncbi:MAG: hypothetical protein VYE54_03995 [Pseudomonadota bacterium]|nr:hypothetical protein [Pseudomonadota bacterium]
MSSHKNLFPAAIAPGLSLPPFTQTVTATTVVLGAMASRDWRPMHHDRDFAINRNGVKDIFLNTPTQAGWFERYLFDWAGPAARLGKMRFAMKASIFPDATMQFSGKVDAVTPSHCGRWVWVDVQLAIHLDDGELASTCEARLAVPQGPEVNLWSVPAAEWQP